MEYSIDLFYKVNDNHSRSVKVIIITKIVSIQLNFNKQ